MNFNFPLHLQILVFSINFLLKTIINIFISWKENNYILKPRLRLGKLFKGYIYLPRIFHLRSNTSEIIKNLTTEMDYFIGIISSFYNCNGVNYINRIRLFLLFINYKIAIISFSLLILFSLIINFVNSKIILEMGKKELNICRKDSNILLKVSQVKNF